MSIRKDIEFMLRKIKTLAVVCNQWGDTGKGKLIDLFAEWADCIIRGTGMDNAGHTIEANGQKMVTHLVPSGILRDKDGKINVIGSGVAVNPAVLLQELKMLVSAGLSYDNLMIALNAKLVLPIHILLDQLRESNQGKIGTTGRGAGPVFGDHTARLGLVVNDLLNPDIMKKKLIRNHEEKIPLIGQYDTQLVKEIMAKPALGGGGYYHPKSVIDIDAVVEQYQAYGQKLKSMICDTDAMARSIVGRKKILLEGAQGLLLSVNHGSYPFVTSSDCTYQGLAHGAGLPDSKVDLVIGIFKAFYMTRVGAGPFPTEIGGQKSEKWCATQGLNKANEREMRPDVTVNSRDEFEQGMGIRMAGDEYGATTGRPRRIGWFDSPLASYAASINGPCVALTKLDVLDECESIKVCTHYIYRGEPFQYGDRLLKNGDRIKVAIPVAEVLEYCEPVYREFPGWLTSTRNIRNYADLPLRMRDIIDHISHDAGIEPCMISVGPDRDETIFYL